MRALFLLAAVPGLLLADASVRSAASSAPQGSFGGLLEVMPAVAVAEAGREIRVGDTLQAVREVSLDEAVLAEGAKVNVSAKHAKNGSVMVDVALADGHVVRDLPLAEVQKNFRRVE